MYERINGVLVDFVGSARETSRMHFYQNIYFASEQQRPKEKQWNQLHARMHDPYLFSI